MQIADRRHGRAKPVGHRAGLRALVAQAELAPGSPGLEIAVGDSMGRPGPAIAAGRNPGGRRAASPIARCTRPRRAGPLGSPAKLRWRLELDQTGRTSNRDHSARAVWAIIAGACRLFRARRRRQPVRWRLLRRQAAATENGDFETKAVLFVRLRAGRGRARPLRVADDLNRERPPRCRRPRAGLSCAGLRGDRPQVDGRRVARRVAPSRLRRVRPAGGRRSLARPGFRLLSADGNSRRVDLHLALQRAAPA